MCCDDGRFFKLHIESMLWMGMPGKILTHSYEFDGENAAVFVAAAAWYRFARQRESLLYLCVSIPCVVRVYGDKIKRQRFSS